MSSNEEQEDGSLGSLLSELRLTRCSTCNGGPNKKKELQNRNKITRQLVVDRQYKEFHSRHLKNTFSNKTNNNIHSLLSNVCVKTHDDDISYEISSSIFEPRTSKIELFEDADSSGQEFDNCTNTQTNSSLSVDSITSIKEAVQPLNENSIKAGLRSDNVFEKRNKSFLLKGRCTSLECGCVKTFDSAIELSTVSSKSINSFSQTLRDLSTQACESARGLKLIDSNGEVEIQENSAPRILIPRVRSTLSVGPESDIASLRPYTEQTLLHDYLRITSDKNFFSDQKENSESMSECSQDFPSSSKFKSYHKSQNVNSAYERFLHKIDKLKKIASWKSRKRKAKVKISLDIPNHHQVSPEESCRVNLNKHQSMSVCTSGLVEKAEVSSLIGILAQTETDKSLTPVQQTSEELFEGSENKDICNVGTQSVKSCYAAIGHNRSRIDTQKSLCMLRADIYNKPSSSHTLRNMKSRDSMRGSGDHSRIRERRKEPSSLRFPRGYSASTEHYRSTMAIAEEWSEKETRQEILQHLKQINKIIERRKPFSASSCQIRTESDRVIYVDDNPRKQQSRISQVRTSASNLTNRNKKLEDGSSGIKVYWAVTKVTKYPDNCKTYEVMKPSRKKPSNVPSTSETVFVLIPK